MKDKTELSIYLWFTTHSKEVSWMIREDFKKRGIEHLLDEYAEKRWQESIKNNQPKEEQPMNS